MWSFNNLVVKGNIKFGSSKKLLGDTKLPASFIQQLDTVYGVMLWYLFTYTLIVRLKLDVEWLLAVWGMSLEYSEESLSISSQSFHPMTPMSFIYKKHLSLRRPRNGVVCTVNKHFLLVKHECSSWADFFFWWNLECFCL